MNRVVKAGIIALALCAGLLAASPAVANTSQGYVYGGGTVTDDWGDEGVLSTTQHAYSGATGLWQWVLFADGAVESDGTLFDHADIDCVFGSNTAAATRDWQRKHSLSADGVVGVNTFSKADDYLVDKGDGWLEYHGAKNTINFERINGEYWYTDPNVGNEWPSVPATYGPPPNANGHDCWI